MVRTLNQKILSNVVDETVLHLKSFRVPQTKQQI